MSLNLSVGITLIALIGVGITTTLYYDYEKDLTLEQLAQQQIEFVIDQYELNPDAPLSKLNLGVNPYVFVLDHETKLIIAHPNSTNIGDVAFLYGNSVESESLIMETIDMSGSMWVHYDWINQESNTIQQKTSFLQFHDGLIFGSGFFK